MGISMRRLKSSAFGRVSTACWTVLLLFISIAYSQDSGRDDEQVKAGEQPGDYVLGPDNQLSLRVFGLDELNQTIRISNSGKMHVPYVGILSVANMTVAQVEDLIVTRLREQGLMKEPWVSIRVTEYNSQPVFVVGEVATPGQFMLSGEMHVLDAISKAGGLTTTAGDEGFLIRRRRVARPTVEGDLKNSAAMRESEQTQIVKAISPGADTAKEIEALGTGIKISFKQLKDGTRMDMNVKLQGADILYVPQRLQQKIYIVGDIPFPGSYGLPRNYDHITAAQAVAYAGGPRRTSKKGFIMRRTETQGVEEIAFDFSAIMKGKQPDIAVKPNDIIYVPRSIGKTITWKMLDLFAFFTQQFIIF